METPDVSEDESEVVFLPPALMNPAYDGNWPVPARGPVMVPQKSWVNDNFGNYGSDTSGNSSPKKRDATNVGIADDDWFGQSELRRLERERAERERLDRKRQEREKLARKRLERGQLEETLEPELPEKGRRSSSEEGSTYGDLSPKKTANWALTESDFESAESDGGSVAVDEASTIRRTVGFGSRTCGGTVCCSKGYGDLLGTKEAACLLLSITDSDPVSHRVPLTPDDNCIFVFDLRSLWDWKDILSDNLGSWTQNRGPRTYEFTKNFAEVTAARKRSAVPEELYVFDRVLYKNAHSKDYKRLVIRSLDERVNYVLVQYKYDGIPHPIEVPSHGNRTGSALPYARSFESTKSTIKAQGRKESMKTYGVQVQNMYDFEHPAEMPRGKRQILNLTQSDQPAEDLVEVMVKCKKEHDSRATRFIQKIIPVPKLSVLLASERQLDDLVKFCTNAAAYCVMGIDTTFNLGKFYVTLVTYRRLLLRSQRATVGIHPVMIGAFFLHQEKSARMYRTLAQTLKKLRPELANLKAYGSDEDPALYQPFQTEHPEALQFICDLHLDDTLVRKMRELQMSQDEMYDTKTDIMGKRVGTELVGGLVNNFEAEYDEQAQMCLEKWELRSEKSKLFAEYFRQYKYEQIRKCLLLENRLKAGLRFDLYNQNANECMNNVLKGKAQRTKQTLDQFVEIARNLAFEQTRMIEQAALGMNDRVTLLEQYQSLRIKSSDMYNSAINATPADRQRAGESIHKAKLLPRDPAALSFQSQLAPVIGDNEHDNHAEDNDRCAEVVNGLSKLTAVSSDTKARLTERVLEILNDNHAVTFPPGQFGMRKYLVASKSAPQKFHQVDGSAPKGKVVCVCLRYKTSKICAHAIAIAVLNNSLDAYVNWHNRSSNPKPNLDSLVGHGLLAAAGKKPKTQRRLGTSKPGVPLTGVTTGSGRAVTEGANFFATTPRVAAGNTSTKRVAGLLEKDKADRSQSTKRMKTSYPTRSVTTLPDDATTSVSKKKAPNKSNAKVAPATSPGPVHVAPKPYEWEVHFLDDCHPSVRTCAGCHKGLLIGRIVPPAPLDLVLVTQIERSIKTAAGNQVGRMGNAYFHLRKDCVRKETSIFVPEDVRVLPEVLAKMFDVHKNHVKHVFGVGLSG